MSLSWMKRQDLIAVPHDSSGWVVKDPLTLNYAWLDDAEFAILNLLDGRMTFTETLREIRSYRWPDRQLSIPAT
ncbi:MAG: hypothetical protein R3C49_21670 [Planctomycetaceae bacterium]